MTIKRSFVFEGNITMDNLERLELEYEGIKGTILEYTSEGNIVNFLDGLKKQIDIYYTSLT